MSDAREYEKKNIEIAPPRIFEIKMCEIVFCDERSNKLHFSINN